MEIVIIGTGNTAYILGRKLIAAGHEVVQVYGRNAKAASDLAYELNTESTNYWSVVNRSAHLYLLAVSDIALEEIVKELQLPSGTVVHTAASVSKDVLQGSAPHYGVFYPLQSLKKDLRHLPDTPIIIDASDGVTLELLTALGSSISETVVPAAETDRMKLHLAAVFCNNFVNHLYTLAEDFCRREGIEFRLLIPLIKETAQRLEELPPAEAQTGPAIRNDLATIKRHEELLLPYPELAKIYDLLTESIQKRGAGAI